MEASKGRKGTTMKKHLIWTNYELEEDRKWIEEEYPEMEEDEREELLQEMIADNLDADRDNLDILVSGEILVIADLGLWFGRRTGYKEITSRRISDNSTEYATWWVDERGDLCAVKLHARI